MVHFLKQSEKHKRTYCFLWESIKIADACNRVDSLIFLQEAKSSNLDKFELPAKIKLLPDPWTLESGLVTAALKLKREAVKAKFKDELEKLYQ